MPENEQEFFYGFHQHSRGIEIKEANGKDVRGFSLAWNWNMQKGLQLLMVTHPSTLFLSPFPMSLATGALILKQMVNTMSIYMFCPFSFSKVGRHKGNRSWGIAVWAQDPKFVKSSFTSFIINGKVEVDGDKNLACCRTYPYTFLFCCLVLSVFFFPR